MEDADRPATLIIVAPDLAGFYDFVKPRQEAEGRSIVVLLDRRHGERRQGERRREMRLPPSDRRQMHRRSQPAAAASALMAVLGFSILHRQGDRYTA